MSAFSRDLLTLLTPAIDAGRAVLADLEADEIPQPLRRVVAHSGGRLPPPLAKSLLEALDREDWLRKKAREHLAESDKAGPAGAFLDREAGWWAQVADGLAAARADGVRAATEKAEAKAAALAGRLDVAKDRLRKAGADLDVERARSKNRPSATGAAAATAAAAKAARAREKSLAAELSEVVQDRADAEAMVARLRSRLRRLAREQRSRQARARDEAAPGRDPVAAARALDLLAASAPHRPPEASLQPPEAASGAPAFELPPGTRPDGREAIEWLANVAEPVTLLVDGYNVLFGMDPASFTTGRSRDLLGEHLSRLRRAVATARVAVVYDSDLPGDRDMRVLPSGVEVHFADEDHLADDEIVALAEAAQGAVVVITSDRDLRERVEDVGAVALWSEALTEWIRGRAG